MITPNDHYGQATSLDPTQIDPQIITIAALFLFMIIILGLKELAPILPERLRRRFQPHPAVQNTLHMAQQLEAVRTVRFEPVSILKREEARLLPALEDAAERLGRGHRVLVQMSLAEMIRPEEGSGSLPERRAAAAAIAAQHLDFAVVDRTGRLVLAVHYNGTGRYLPEAFARQTLTREAVERAGVAFLEVSQGFDDDEVFRRVYGVLKNAGGPAIEATGRPVKLAKA